MSDVVEVNTTQHIVEVNPPAGLTVEVVPIESIVTIEIAAPGGFSGGVGVEAFPLWRNSLTVSTGGSPLPLDGDYTWESASLAVGQAPTGADIILDINKNGTTLYTTQANRPRVTAGGTNGTVLTPNVTTFTAGDKITVDIDQVGSTFAGANLVLILRLRRVS